MLTILMTTGPYDIPKAEAIAKVVVTNTTPIGAYRGRAGPKPLPPWSGRSTCSPWRSAPIRPTSVARTCWLPFTEPHRTAFGALYDSGDYVAALDKALAAAGYASLREEQASDGSR